MEVFGLSGDCERRRALHTQGRQLKRDSYLYTYLRGRRGRRQGERVGGWRKGKGVAWALLFIGDMAVRVTSGRATRTSIYLALDFGASGGEAGGGDGLCFQDPVVCVYLIMLVFSISPLPPLSTFPPIRCKQ